MLRCPRLQRLFTLMPFLQARMLRMQPKLLAALAAQPQVVAARMIELRGLLPGASVEAVLSQRPSLLLEGEWERVAGGVVALQARYSESEVARLATAEPLLLVADLEEVLQELGRWVGRVCKCGGCCRRGTRVVGELRECVGGEGSRRCAALAAAGPVRPPDAAPAPPAGSCRSSSQRPRCWRSPAWPAA